MEGINEYLDGRISSLLKKIESCEEERRSIIWEVSMLKRGSSLNPKNNNSGAGRRIEEVCDKVRGILENIMVTVKSFA